MVEPKKVSYNEALAHIIERFNKTYSFHTFVCSVCGKTIEPMIKVWGDEIFIKSGNNTLIGGIGNKVIKKNVCDDCLRKVNSGIKLNNSEVELS